MPIERDNLRKEFESLSTRYGGSLLFEKTRMDQSTVAVFIGLGGLGGRAVNAIKAATTEKLNNPDRRFFLVVDTCRKDMNKISSATAQDLARDDEENERIHGFIDADEKMTLYSDSFKIGALGHGVDSWLDRAAFNERVVDDNGAQGLRQIGRVMLLGRVEKYTERYNQLREILLKAKNKAEDEGLPMKVYIIAGIGGGTGSGTTVDFAYMVRKAMADFALEHQKVEGVLFTPDVQKNDRGMDDDYYNSLCVNFYAAIKEIDYFYNNKARGKQYECPVGNQEDAYKEDIFDECTLVSSLAGGVSMARNSDELVLKFANAIAFELGGIQGTATDGTTQSYDAFYSNVQTYFRYWFTNNSEGRGLDVPDFVPHRYSTLGYSSFYIPRDEIMAYCANKLVERMVEDWKEKDITAKEIETFLKKYGLFTNRQFAEKLFNMANCSELFDVDKKRLPVDGWGPSPVKNFVSYLEDMEEIARDNSRSALLNQYITLAKNKLNKEIIKPIITAVDKAFTSPDGRGPVYAINLLSANQIERRGIIRHLEEMINSIDDDVRTWKSELQNRGSLLSQIAEESDGKSSIDEEKLGNFTDETRKYGEDLLKVAILDAAKEIFQKVYSTLVDENNKAFSIYTTTFEFLRDMLKKDSDYVLNTERHREGHTTVFTFDLANFKANDVRSARFKEYFDKVINIEDVNTQSRIFINDVFCNLKSNLAPVDGNPVDFTEKDIIDILRNYFCSAFDQWTRETIEKFCVVAYSDVDVDPDFLTKVWKNNPELKATALQLAATAIESKLDNGSGVLLTSADPTRNVENFAHYSAVYGLLSTPDINRNFDKQVTCAPNNWSEYISYKRIFGFPVSLMKSLKEYRELYYEQRMARGMHLDEMGDDWRYSLPDPFDYNISKYLGLYTPDGLDVTEDDHRRMKKILELARKAKELGILEEVSDAAQQNNGEEAIDTYLYRMHYELRQNIDVDQKSEEIYQNMRDAIDLNIANGETLMRTLEAANYTLGNYIDIKWSFVNSEYSVMKKRNDFGDDVVFGNFITLIRSNYEWELKLQEAVDLFGKLDEIYKRVLAEFASAKIYEDRIASFMDAIMVGRFTPIYDDAMGLFRGFCTKVTEKDEDSVNFTNRGFRAFDNMYLLYLAFTESFLKIDDAKFTSLKTLIKRDFDTNVEHSPEARQNVEWFLSHIREVLENKEYLGHYDVTMMKENFERDLAYSFYGYSVPKNSSNKQNIDVVIENVKNFYKTVEGLLNRNKVTGPIVAPAPDKDGVSVPDPTPTPVPGDGWTCASCGAANQAVAKFCLQCGTEHTPAPIQTDVWNCSNQACRATNNGGKFCMQCGTPRPATTLFCTGCGKQLQPDARFCPSCGTKV